jgi:hypothetical protein
MLIFGLMDLCRWPYCKPPSAQTLKAITTPTNSTAATKLHAKKRGDGSGITGFVWFPGMGLERSMHPAEQPTDSERGYNGRIRLRFNLIAQPCLYRACILPHDIGSLAVQVLGCPCGLIHDPLNFGFGIAGGPADALLNLAADISRAAFQTIPVHDWPFQVRLVYFD